MFLRNLSVMPGLQRLIYRLAILLNVVAVAWTAMLAWVLIAEGTTFKTGEMLCYVAELLIVVPGRCVAAPRAGERNAHISHC
jgi:hypothetical protein